MAKRPGWLLAMIGLLSGCATHALWKNPAFDGFNEPAAPTNLQIYRTADNFLVQYDELRERDERVFRRAYYVEPNRDLIANRKMPRFVSVSHVPKSSQIVSQCDDLATNALRAVVSPDGSTFTLYAGSENRGTFDLPVYPTPSGRLKQIALTPCTFVADLTIIGGFVATYFWLPAGAPGLANVH